jgi:hypothetical protein
VVENFLIAASSAAATIIAPNSTSTQIYTHEQYKLQRGFTAADLGADFSDVSDAELLAEDDYGDNVNRLVHKAVVCTQKKKPKQATMKTGAATLVSKSKKPTPSPPNASSFSSLTTTTNTALCDVCDMDKVNGCHYGAMVCYKCASFFANSFTREYYKEKCVGVGGGCMRCDVSGPNRDRCRKCRLLQCLRVGMRPNSQIQYKNALNYVYEHQQLVLEMFTNKKSPQQPQIKQVVGSYPSRQSLPNMNSTTTHSASRLYALCQVCHMDTPIGLRYGAYTCASCLAFFQRSLHRNYCNRYKCAKGNELCDINGSNRINCRKCRLNKCLEVGMRPTNQKMLSKARQYLNQSINSTVAKVMISFSVWWHFFKSFNFKSIKDIERKHKSIHFF